MANELFRLLESETNRKMREELNKVVKTSNKDAAFKCAVFLILSEIEKMVEPIDSKIAAKISGFFS